MDRRRACIFNRGSYTSSLDLVEIADDTEEVGCVRTGVTKAKFQISSDLRLEKKLIKRIEWIE